MPFKTRSRKVAAESRHVVNFSENAVISYSADKEGVILTQKNPKSGSGEISRTIEADYGFVKRELRKITLLAAIVIGLQIALKLSHLSFLS